MTAEGWWRVAIYVVLIALGVMLALWGAFLVPLRIGRVEGLSDLIAFGGNLAAGLLAARALRDVPAAAMPGIGWLVMALVTGTYARPSDEVVVPGKLGNDPGIGTVGQVFLFAGAVGAVLAVVLAGRLVADRRTP